METLASLLLSSMHFRHDSNSALESAEEASRGCAHPAADDLLTEFVARHAAINGDTAMTFNIHQLLHLARCAENLGPLWARSAFVFEGGNGVLLKYVTAAKGAPLQVLERVAMLQELS